jgi:hypothetical protein
VILVNKESTENSQNKYLALLLLKDKIRKPLIDLTTNEIGLLNFGFGPNKLDRFQMEIHKICIKEINYPMGVCWSGVDCSRFSTSYQYAAIDYSNCNLIQFDKKLEIKKCLKISYQNIDLIDRMRPIRLETDSGKLFYILDKSTHHIFILKENNRQNLDIYNEIKETCKDICFFNGILYVLCSQANDLNQSVCEVRQFSSIGLFKMSIHLFNVTYKNVTSLKISKNFIGVLEGNTEMKLYDLSGMFKFKLNQGASISCFCFADNHVLTLDNDGLLKCYDLDTLNLECQSTRSLPKNESFFMGYFGKEIFISYPWKKEFCILK